MATSATVQAYIVDFLSDGRTRGIREIKAFLSASDIGAYTEGQFAGSLNTLLRRGTIRKVSRGKYKMRNSAAAARRTCFVVSPIGEAGSETRDKADKLFKHIIKPVCDDCGLEAIRVDQLNDANSITQTIIEKLETADLVIADVSGNNPNVFYETGFRTCTNKPIIHLKAKGERLPFDITVIRAFDYDLTDLDDVDQVKGRLKQTIQSLSFPTADDAEPDEDEGTHHENDVNLLPILYQILDAVSALQSTVKTNNIEIIQTVIQAMQSSRPQSAPEPALQAELLTALMDNPEGLAKLAGLAGRLPTKAEAEKDEPAAP